MKLGINARTFQVADPEGAVQVGIHQAKELKSNDDIELVLFGHEKVSDIVPGTNVESGWYPKPLSSQIFGVLWERLVLPMQSKEHELDLLFCPNANGPLHPISCPIVVGVHDVNAQLGMSSRIHQLYRRLTVPRCVSVADLIITVSEFSKRELCRVTAIPESKVKVIYNGIDEIYLSNTSGKQVDLPDEYILFVGSLNPRKNITALVKAFERVKQRNDIPHKLVLAGPPNRLVFKNIDFEQTEDVQHLGFLSAAELKYAYRRATVFAYPSLYEGFGLPPLEAMASGTAVLASDTGPFPEILGSAAELVDPTDIEAIANGLERLLRDESQREKFEQRGQERASNFTWKKAGKELKSAFEGAV